MTNEQHELCETELRILGKLRDGTLEWGAAVGVCWPRLAKIGYVEPNFGGITNAGLAALKREEGRE